VKDFGLGSLELIEKSGPWNLMTQLDSHERNILAQTASNLFLTASEPEKNVGWVSVVDLVKGSEL